MALTIDELNIQIAADSSKASRALTNLIKKLDKLKAALSDSKMGNITITNSFNQTTNSIKKATTATEKHSNTTKKAAKSSRSFSDNLAYQVTKFRTLFGVFRNLAKMMGGWFNESNKYIETLNLFNVTMGDAAEGAKEFAESVQSAMGIDAAEWMQNQGVFKNLVYGFGVAEDAANTMSQNLTQLSYDMASFFNTDVETAFDKLSSAMAGQVKGLREFGIDTTVASLQEYALARGIDTSVRSMTQAEKAMLRYNLIMEKSILMQGDMARTIATPSNALRILSAQFTQLKRAMGNVISVIAVKLIPYVQATVRVITDAANALAKLFGFELPTIDYDSLKDLDTGGFGDEFEDENENANELSGTIKKIKKQLMGFDELNIISDPASDSGGGTSDTTSSLGNMEVREYDFLKGLDTSVADEIYKKVKKLLSPLGKVASVLYDFRDTIKTIFKVLIGFSLLKKVKLLVGLLVDKGIIKNISGAATAMKNLTKFAVGAAAGVIEFVVIKDAVKSLALSCEDVGAKVLTAGTAFGVAAGVMYAAFGPAGIAVAAVVGLAGVIAGFNAAHEEMVKQFVNDVFYDGVGTKISELASDFKYLMDSIVESNQPILDNKAIIEEATKSIDKTNTSISQLFKSYERGVIDAEKFAEQLATNLETLNSNVKKSMDATYDNITRALSGSLGDAIETSGGQVDEYLKIINRVKNDGDTLYDTLIKKQQELSVQFANNEISSEEYAKGLLDVNNKLSTLAGSTSIVTNFSDKIEGLRKTVNWESEDAANTAFDTINSSAIDAKASVNESCDEIKRNLETMKSWTTDQEAIAAIDELLLGNEESRKAQLAEVDNAVYTMFDNLKEDLMTGMGETAEAAKAAGEDVSEMVSEYADNIFLPLSLKMSKSLTDLGADGAEWAESALNEVVNTLAEFGGPEAVAKVQFKIDAMAKLLGADGAKVFKKTGKDAGQGYIDGIDAMGTALGETMTDFGQTGIDALKEAQDSNSPAKEYIALGEDAVDGYVKGISDNFPDVEDTFSESFTNLFDDIETLVSENVEAVSETFSDFSADGITDSLDEITKKAGSVFKLSTWKEYAKNVTTALAGITMPTFKNIGLNVTYSTWVSADNEKVYKALGLPGFPYLNWYAYANGGFPTMGEMFIAREAGPEMVGQIGRKTAVANNDQIVSGIESGVYRAMMAANSTHSGGTQTIRIINEIDGDVVGEKVIQYHNGKVIQTGASPLLV